MTIWGRVGCPILIAAVAAVCLATMPGLQHTASAEAMAIQDDLYDPFAESAPAAQAKSVIQDPMVRLNRKIFRFNDRFYFAVLRPVSRGYKRAVPAEIRRAVRNLFTNLLEPVYFLNSVLQQKPKDAEAALKRLVVNSTVGIGGLFEPARKPSDSQKRGFDQTFSKWGVAPGMYLVLPFLGSTSVRGAFGLACEEALDPVNYGEEAAVGAGAAVFETVNETSFQIGNYEDLKKYSLDAYSSLKDIYEKKIHKKAQD